MTADEQAERAMAIATAICIEFNDIKEGYARWLFLQEIKDQTAHCWECGYLLGPTGYCTCRMDD